MTVTAGEGPDCHPAMMVHGWGCAVVPSALSEN